MVHLNKFQRAEKRFREASSSSQTVDRPKKRHPSKFQSASSSIENRPQRLPRSTFASQIKRKWEESVKMSVKPIAQHIISKND